MRVARCPASGIYVTMTDDDDRAEGPPTLHPGQELREWLVTHDLTQKWLAARVHVSTKHLSQIINGHTGYGIALAARIARATGHDSRYWWQRLTDYRLDQVRREEPRD